MSEKLYPYASARIQAMENRMLTNETLEQMAAAPSAEEAFSYLLEAGYGEGVSAPHLSEYETLLSSELTSAYATVRSLVPEEKLFDLFLYRWDYHNIKVLIKQELSGSDGRAYLTDRGSIAPDKLEEILRERSYQSLPRPMAEAVEEALSVYNKTGDIGLSCSLLDKAALRSMLRLAKEEDNGFVLGFVRRLIDSTNLKTYLRVWKRGGAYDEFSPLFIPGGTVSAFHFEEAMKSGRDGAKAFGGTEYERMCEIGIESGFTLFEKLADDFLMDYMKNAKLHPLTADPVFAYLYAKETEIQCARIIMVGKMNGIETEVIRERLRESYV